MKQLQKQDNVSLQLMGLLESDIKSPAEIFSLNEIITLVKEKMASQQRTIEDLKKSKARESSFNGADLDDKETQKQNFKDEKERNFKESLLDVIGKIYMEEHSKQFFLNELQQGEVDAQKLDYITQVQMSTQKIMKLLSQLNKNDKSENQGGGNQSKEQLEDSVSCSQSQVQAQSLNGSKRES